MKLYLIIQISIIILLFSRMGLLENYKITTSTLPETTQYNKLKFPLDSGYINKKEGLQFLLSNSLSDTANSAWYLMKETDTIGKYYKVNESGNFYLCLIDYSNRYTFETHLIIEVNPSGDVLESERFRHGNYPCCWRNYYDGFNKYGEYFGIITCGTGSGYCASHLYLFKQLISQDEQKSIPEDYWSCGPNGEFHSLNSTMEFQQGNLIMHYKLDYGKMSLKGKNKVKKTKSFDAIYTFKDNKWTTNDSTKLRDLDVW